MNEATVLLRDKTLEFMKRYAVSPPSSAGMAIVPDPTRVNEMGEPMNKTVPAQTMSAKRDIWTDRGEGPTRKIKVGTGTVSHHRVKKGGVQHASVTDPTEIEKRGAKTLELSSTPSSDRVPIHFLPWASETLIDIRLPEDKSDGTDPDNPNIFFTAALSGCSVFVDGHPARPRVVHAGITGKLAGDAGEFWDERLHDLARSNGEPIDDHLRSIDKSMYSGTSMAWQYRQWLNHEYRDTMTIKSTKEWASVFGIRYGRLWSFYLQRNCAVTTTRLVKKDSFTSRESGQKTWRTHTETGLAVEQITKRKGKGPFKRNKHLYMLTQTYNKPLAIEEIYPQSSREGGVQIRPEMRHMALM